MVVSYEISEDGSPRGKMGHKVHEESGTTFCGQTVAHVCDENTRRSGGRAVWPDLGLFCQSCETVVQIVRTWDIKSLPKPDCKLRSEYAMLFRQFDPPIHQDSPAWLHCNFGSATDWLAITTMRLLPLGAPLPEVCEARELTPAVAEEFRRQAAATGGFESEADRADYLRWVLGPEPSGQNVVLVKELVEDPPVWRRRSHE